MSNYVVTLYNRKKKEWKNQDVKVLTFAEAFRAAHLDKNRMGFDWEISSISKIIEDTEVHVKGDVTI